MSGAQRAEAGIHGHCEIAGIASSRSLGQNDPRDPDDAVQQVAWGEAHGDVGGGIRQQKTPVDPSEHAVPLVLTVMLGDVAPVLHA